MKANNIIQECLLLLLKSFCELLLLITLIASILSQTLVQAIKSDQNTSCAKIRIKYKMFVGTS